MFRQFGTPFFQGAGFCWEKTKWLVSEAHGVVRVRLLPWPFCLPDHSFVSDSDPHGSKSRSEGIPWQFFSRRISWQGPNSTKTREMCRKNQGFPKNPPNFAKIGGIPENRAKSPEIIRNRVKNSKIYYLGVWGVGGMAGGP